MLLCMGALSAQEFIFENYGAKVEAHLLLPYELFIFARDADAAEYQLSLQVKNARGKQLISEEKSLIIPRREWLQNCAILVVNNWELEYGTHTLSLNLRNRKLGDKHSFSRTFRVGTQGTEIGNAYLFATREGIEYIPNNMDISAVESLVLKQSFALGIERIILDHDGENSVFLNPQSPFELDLAEFYQSESLGELTIYLDELNIRYKAEPLLYSPWFSFAQKYSFKDQMEQIRYIATQNQLKALRKIPKDRYEEAIESFWQAKDPSPGTLRNETRELFYKRVVEADQRFSIHKRLPGWRSDRGRIYIKFGEPEQIVNDAFPLGRPPSIVWHYFKLNRSFVFEDEKGFGQYRLMNKNEEYEDL